MRGRLPTDLKEQVENVAVKATNTNERYAIISMKESYENNACVR